MTSQHHLVGAHIVFYKFVKTPYDEDGKQREVQAVLLYKRTSDAPIHPSYWGLIGGSKSGDEDIKETAKREATEELETTGMNIVLEDMEGLCSILIIRGQSIKKEIQYYKAKLDRDMDCLKLKKNEKGKVEGEGLAWFTEEEVHHLYLRPEDRKALRFFFD